ncbi:MAG: MXAN_6640 family putative metalloprotease, partial [Solirubrobacterales bacterium]
MRKRVGKAGLKTAVGFACLCAIASTAQASAPFSEAEAKQQLRAAEAILEGAMPKAELTIALRDLALALPKLDGSAERRAERILSRPPDGTGRFGGSWPDNAKEQTVETPAFVIHYAKVPDCKVDDENCDEPDKTDNAPSNGIPDYVDATVDAVNESIQVENDELGWPDPKGDGNEGEPQGSSETDRFDIYLSDLCGSGSCVFGYAQPDDNSNECSANFRCSAHLVLDNDYAEFGQSGGLLGLRVTTAHEYNHVLQFNLDTNQDDWMFESTATWSEEQVFPNDDDWVRSYMDSWARETEIPITKSEFHIYGSAVWNHWLENGDNSYGPDVILNAWESSRDVTPKDYAVGAYNDAILDEGGAGFSQEFSAFTAATAEWNAGDGNFPDAAELPEVQRLGKLNLGDKSRKQVLDNTAYAL